MKIFELIYVSVAIIALVALLGIFAADLLCDPEFAPCDVEIITIDGDTTRLFNVVVEFEGRLDIGAGSDNIMIIGPYSEYNFLEKEIRQMTITFRNEQQES